MFKQLTARIILILGVSIAAFGISLLLDVLLAPLSPIFQFLVQVPALVLLIEESRRLALAHEETLGLNELEINGAFFLAAPLAAFAALTLFADIRKVIKPHARV